MGAVAFGNFKICYSTNAYYRIHANNLSKSKTITSNDVGVFRNSFYNSRYFKSHLTKYTSLEKYFISKILPINVNNKEYYSVFFVGNFSYFSAVIFSVFNSHMAHSHLACHYQTIWFSASFLSGSGATDFKPDSVLRSQSVFYRLRFVWRHRLQLQ